MPQRAASTARERRLGVELRKMRERVGMNAAQAAEALGVNRTRISNIEAGRLRVSAERVRVLASIYSCADNAYIESLAAMAEERAKGWWEEYRGVMGSGVLDLAELEYHAAGMRSVQIMHIPGLLQSEDYARAVFSTAVPGLTPVELRRRLSFRLRRRDVLDRDVPPRCTFLIHEAALRMQFGNAKIVRGQMEYLLEASERTNVTVRVIPFSAGGFPNAGSSTLYAMGPVPQLDTVQLDVANAVSMLDAEGHLENYRAVLDRTEELSLTPAATRDFIRAAERQL